MRVQGKHLHGKPREITYAQRFLFHLSMAKLFGTSAEIKLRITHYWIQLDPTMILKPSILMNGST